MDINTAGAGAGTGDVTPSGAFCQWTSSASLSFQHFLDKTTPYLLYRWIAFFFIAVLYVVRVYLVEGFYVISYALGIYLLNLLIGFLSPQVDPELQDLSDGPTLPTRETDEFRPFVRRLPEFKFWYSITKAFCIAFVLTFFSVLMCLSFGRFSLYWVVLFTLTMRRQIRHMLKYKYLPFSFGKQRYDGKKAASSESEDLLP
ncbi:hypothetical protein H5410_009104 [Solanum commersonii]|uniref:Protein RER1 n=1 Tax=Solanum commersonii TaxID=4109 RepID=A0A9J6AGX1_SOLCO|nr:hypothetical protein H5410_009104 [Solanum commersonii]